MEILSLLEGINRLKVALGDMEGFGLGNYYGDEKEQNEI